MTTPNEYVTAVEQRESNEFDRYTSHGETGSAGDPEMVGLANSQQNDTSIDWALDSSWPLSNAWQWTYEDLYLQEPTNFSSLNDDGSSSALLFGLENSSSPIDVSSSLLVNATEPVTSISRSPQLENTECLMRDEDDGGIVEPVAGGVHSRRDPGAIATHLTNLAASANAYINRYSVEWQSLDTELLAKIAITRRHSRGCSGCLDELIQRYFVHFHPLWPLIVDTSIDLSKLHPLLFLTLASIGALYHENLKARRFGSVLHSKIREKLIQRHIASDQTALEALEIGRAILLTQVAALYFEQEKAFSAAQQLGAKLNSQAYRMRLFSQANQPSTSESRLSREADAPIQESRLMLAFGTLRAEAFISVFFNRKPLLSYEEVNLPLPHGGFSENASNGQQMRTLRQQTAPSPCADMLFSDLVRVALDEEESLPLMRPTELELLLFGLQNDVWRFSHDHGMFNRLVQGRAQGAGSKTSNGESLLSTADLLDQTSRKMRHLLHDYKALVSALHRWKMALSQSQLAYPAEQDRSAYLSGLILYELSLLRLSAPIESILQLVYQQNAVHETNVVASEVLKWTASTQVQDSVAHAESIYKLLKAEISRPFANQAKYNILALIAVHHAAAVIWAVIGGGRHQTTRFNLTESPDSDHADSLTLVQANAAWIISSFADLYPKITASRGVQSSFHKIVKRLAHLPFALSSQVDAIV